MSSRHKDGKIWIRIAALALAGLLALGVLFSAVTGWAEEEPARDRYSLDIEVLFEEQAVRISQTIDYTNRTGRTISGMMFNVYANILRRLDGIPVESEQIRDAFPEGYAPGGVDFMSVTVNGEDAEWGVQGDEELFLRVQCDLAAGETAQFSFEYYLLLPTYSGSMGVGDLSWRLTNFYPVAAVWDEYLEDFPLNGYTAVDEPLHSEAADYEATITLPETYELAAPGEIAAEPDGNGNIRYEIRAQGVRELAILFSRKMTEKRGETQAGTRIRALGNTPGAAGRMLNCALPVMNWLEETFGAYPWPELTLTETEYVYDGISYPGVIQAGATDEETIAGLCVRQYFSGIVGSNPNGAPWLNEALPAFVKLMYYDEKNGHEEYLKRLNAQVIPSLQVTIPGGMTVDSEAGRFNSRMEYEIVVIDRGCVVLHEMRQTMGEEVFLSALQEYVSRNWLKNATAAEFLEAMNEVSGKRWNEYLYGQMHNIDDYVDLDLTWID